MTFAQDIFWQEGCNSTVGDRLALFISTVAFLSVPILVENLPKARDFDPLMDVVVNHDHRGKATCAKTPSNVEGEIAVGCGLSDIDAQFVLECREDLLPAADVTCGTKTDADHVTSTGHGVKE
jgi:hypothetical protein